VDNCGIEGKREDGKREDRFYSDQQERLRRWKPSRLGSLRAGNFQMRKVWGGVERCGAG